MSRFPAPVLAALAAVLAAGSCAHVEAPPGGPDDRIPPEVIATRPAADSIVPGYDGPVVFLFDERISEQRVADAVLVSPRTSPVEVRHGRQEIRVALRRGWEPDVIYHVTLRPTISDLFGNTLAEPTTLVFSTGPPIPETRLAGRVSDRITGANEVGARVEAIRAADSLVYAAQTDTAGRFQLHRIPEGDYLVRAYQDINDSRALDPFEERDSTFATVSIGEPVAVELRLLMPDTTPPTITRATPFEDRIEVEFDDHLDPEQEVEPARVSVTGPAGEPVPLARIVLGSPDGAAAAPAAGADLPTRVLVLELEEDTELPPGEYRVAVSGIRNVNGLVGDSEETFSVAPPPDP